MNARRKMREGDFILQDRGQRLGRPYRLVRLDSVQVGDVIRHGGWGDTAVVKLDPMGDGRVGNGILVNLGRGRTFAAAGDSLVRLHSRADDYEARDALYDARRAAATYAMVDDGRTVWLECPEEEYRMSPQQAAHDRQTIADLWAGLVRHGHEMAVGG